MKITDRRRIIMETLQDEGRADINALAEQLKVSSMTIRRDLKALAANGTVSITQGEAVLSEGALQEYNMLFKHQINLDEKKHIARRALDFVKEGESIFLDAGTTVKELAPLVSRVRNVNIMTNSLLVANSMSNLKEGTSLIMCPGTFREMSLAFLGPMTDDFIKSFKIDLLFLSVEGISLENGATTIDLLDGHTKRTLVQQAKRVICLADSSKFDSGFFYSIAPLADIDLFITDNNLSDGLYDEYIRAGCKIERV